MLQNHKENAFTVLQQRGMSLCAVDACPSMDLVAGISEEGLLFVFRTMSWDKVVQKAGVEIFGSIATALRFSPNGKFISLGSADGRIAIFDIEKASHILALPSSLGGTVDTSSIYQLSWGSAHLLCGDNERKSSTWSEAWLHGGLDTVARAGIAEYTAADGDDGDDSSLALEGVFQSLHGFLLLALPASGRLAIYAYGLFPLYSIALGASPTSQRWRLNDWSLRRGGLSLVKLSNSTDQFSSSLGGFSTINVSQSVFTHYHWQERTAKVLMSITEDMVRVAEIAGQCARKWKDATKLLPMKLGLLQTALEGYELPYNPVSFFYTVAMCGAWHPVAHTTFSSHWNEQGIARFRVGIDMASQYISNAVKLAMVPIATNLQLRCRELEGLMAVASADGIYWKDGHSKHAGAVSALRRSSELLLYKLDDLSSETDKAHDRLKLFLQFVKEYHAACSASPAAAVSPDVQTMRSYMDLFDPRVTRAPATQAMASKALATSVNSAHLPDGARGNCPPTIALQAAEAEAVSGTHLYAFFQEDGKIPVPSVKRIVSMQVLQTAGYSEPSIDTIEAKEEEIDRFHLLVSSLLEKIESVGIVESASAADESFQSRSLLAQLKITKYHITEVADLAATVGSSSEPRVTESSVILGSRQSVVSVESISLRTFIVSLDVHHSSHASAALSGVHRLGCRYTLMDCTLIAFACAQEGSGTTDIYVLLDSYSESGCKLWLSSKIKLPLDAVEVSCMQFYHKLVTPVTTAASSACTETSDLHLIVCTTHKSDEGSCHVIKINVQMIPFRLVDEASCSVPSYDSITAVWPHQLPDDEMDISEGRDEDPCIKIKALPSTISYISSLHVSGQRGLACINSRGSQGLRGKIIVLDLEEDEEDSIEEDASDDEATDGAGSRDSGDDRSV